MNSTHSAQADLVLLVVTMLAAMGWIFSREALLEIPPLLFVVMRFGTSALLLGMMALQGLRQMERSQWYAALRSGACFGAAMSSWIMGLKYGQHLGIGAFLTSLGVVLVPLAAMFWGERPRTSIWFALVLALAGLVCLALDSQFVFGIGELAFLLAACLFAFTFVLTSRAASGIPAMALTTVQFMMVAAVALLLLLISGEASWPASQTTQTWWWLLASILVATCLRFFLQVWAQGKTSASSAAIIMILEPVWAALLGWGWYGEQLVGVQLLGCSLVLMALVASRWSAFVRLLKARSG